MGVVRELRPFMQTVLAVSTVYKQTAAIKIRRAACRKAAE